jgi:hypothetical protein
MQWHSIAFWSEHVDKATGWAWSLLLEGIALWLWSSGQMVRRALGALATLLLLAGPLYQVSSPLFLEAEGLVRGEMATSARRAVLEAEIASLEAALGTYLDNSQKRAGWAERIDRTQAGISTARTSLAALTASNGTPPPRLEWQRRAIICMQALALVLIQVSNVLAITTISRAADEQRSARAREGSRGVGALKDLTAPAQTRKAAREISTPAVSRETGQGWKAPRKVSTRGRPKGATDGHEVAGLQKALRAHLTEKQLTARAFAQRHGFSPRDLSLLLNDQENRLAGKRRAPQKVISRLDAMLHGDALAA